MNVHLNFRFLPVILFFAFGRMVGCSPSVQTGQASCLYPIIGTAYTSHTYQAATTPFGMVRVEPGNGTSGSEFCTKYNDESKTIKGFSHRHLSGTEAAGMGEVLLTPVVGNIPFIQGEENPSTDYPSSFSQDSEQSSLGYYRGKLDDYNILAEMTATPGEISLLYLSCQPKVRDYGY